VYVRDVIESQNSTVIIYDFFVYAIFFAPMEVTDTLFDDWSIA
jgi:hypothetical protein